MSEDKEFPPVAMHEGMRQYLHDKNPGDLPHIRNLQDYVLEHLEFDVKYKMLKEPRDFQHLMYLLVCLGGEVGETQNVFKKFVRDGKLDWDHFAEEAVDVFVYLCMIFGYAELNFEEHYQKKMTELHRRWEERTSGKV